MTQATVATRFLDSSVAHESTAWVRDFLSDLLESSNEYSLIGQDLNGNILAWSDGARRMYGYEPEEIVGKANSSILHVPEDVLAGKPHRIRAPPCATAGGKAWSIGLARMVVVSQP